MPRYNHVLYASRSDVEQIFRDQFGDIDEIEVGSSEAVTGSIGGKLRTLIASFNSKIKGEVRRDHLHRINFEDEMTQTKKVINEILDDKSLNDISELPQSTEDWEMYYKFSSDLFLTREESGFDDDHLYVRIESNEDGLTFEGMTSLENWASRSNIIHALDREHSYPFKGVVTPIELIDENHLRVNFIFVSNPDTEALRDWENRIDTRYSDPE